MIITNAIITFNNHFNQIFTLSDLSELAIILNQCTTIIKIAAIKANAFAKDKIKNSNEPLPHFMFSTNQSVHHPASNFNTDHNIRIHQNNNIDHAAIYHRDASADFTLSPFDPETNNFIQAITTNSTTNAYHTYLITSQIAHQRFTLPHALYVLG